ncbi:ABC transporter ATP-binding protein [Desulfurivibrio dismutans]|uniref:ABC transporter ATP-binding protein n=1 Tax=Desulfurivibrio dismutans TaxID=1398908 RepID=UPI0023DA0416|nr:ATP-binding cassette domain-containing protein [Desulfurivibrio alkaliphilus]MDF1615570.1 ATP-binding cassette domain-containing protein [Desulfurivibrio alkaliphilus]
MLIIEGLRVQEVTLDLTIAPGEIVCLSGPSGSGKSLLLRAVADLIPHRGRISFNGEECAAMPAHLWRRRVGLLPAESQWWATTVGEHFPRPVQAELAALGFGPEVMGWQVTRCSTGERQRLAILRLLALAPAALLLDEPTASLDQESIGRVEGLIDRYRKQHRAPVLWVSHDPAQMARVADRRLQINGTGVEEVSV